jgi:hypothetical protein
MIIPNTEKQLVGADSISAQICMQKNIDCTIELRADMESAPTYIYKYDIQYL